MNSDAFIDDEVVRRLVGGEYVEANPSEMRAAVIGLVRRGQTTRQIAEQFHVSATTVAKWRRMLGMPERAGAPYGNQHAKRSG